MLQKNCRIKNKKRKKEIEGLVNLSETQKTQYKTSVDNAQTVQAVEEALTAAKSSGRSCPDSKERSCKCRD